MCWVLPFIDMNQPPVSESLLTTFNSLKAVGGPMDTGRSKPRVYRDLLAEKKNQAMWSWEKRRGRGQERELESELQDKVDNLVVQIEVRSQQPMSVVLGLDNIPTENGRPKGRGGRNRRQKN